MRLVCFCLPCESQRALLRRAVETTLRWEVNTHVDRHDRQVDVVQQLIMKFDRHAGGEKDHQLLLSVLLQEGEEQQEALL